MRHGKGARSPVSRLRSGCVALALTPQRSRTAMHLMHGASPSLVTTAVRQKRLIPRLREIPRYSCTSSIPVATVGWSVLAPRGCVGLGRRSGGRVHAARNKRTRQRDRTVVRGPARRDGRGARHLPLPPGVRREASARRGDVCRAGVVSAAHAGYSSGIQYIVLIVSCNITLIDGVLYASCSQ